MPPAASASQPEAGVNGQFIGVDVGVRGAALLAALELARGDEAFAAPRSEVESAS